MSPAEVIPLRAAFRDGRGADPRVTVVVPTFNEAKNLPSVFSRLPADLHDAYLDAVLD